MKREDIEKAAAEFGTENNCLRVSAALAEMIVRQVNAVIEEMVVAFNDQAAWYDYDPGETAIEVIRRFKIPGSS